VSKNTNVQGIHIPKIVWETATSVGVGRIYCYGKLPGKPYKLRREGEEAGCGGVGVGAVVFMTNNVVIYCSCILQTVTNLYIANLALADVILAIFCIPFQVRGNCNCTQGQSTYRSKVRG
jgi:hypothetical protein